MNSVLSAGLPQPSIGSQTRVEQLEDLLGSHQLVSKVTPLLFSLFSCEGVTQLKESCPPPPPLLLFPSRLYSTSRPDRQTDKLTN